MTTPAMAIMPSLDDGGHEIMMYEEITEAVAKTFNAQLRDAAASSLSDWASRRSGGQSPRPIVVRVNSPGGELFSSIAMYHTLLDISSRLTVIGVVDGLAASGASLMLMGLRRRVMSPHSFMMIHQLSGQAWGKLSEVNEQVAVMNRLGQTIVEIYVNGSGGKLTKKKARGLLDHDSYFNPTEAIELGLATEVRYSLVSPGG